MKTSFSLFFALLLGFGISACVSDPPLHEKCNVDNRIYDKHRLIVLDNSILRSPKFLNDSVVVFIQNSKIHKVNIQSGESSEYNNVEDYFGSIDINSKNKLVSLNSERKIKCLDSGSIIVYTHPHQALNPFFLNDSVVGYSVVFEKNGSSGVKLLNLKSGQVFDSIDFLTLIDNVPEHSYSLGKGLACGVSIKKQKGRSMSIIQYDFENRALSELFSESSDVNYITGLFTVNEELFFSDREFGIRSLNLTNNQVNNEIEICDNKRVQNVASDAHARFIVYVSVEQYVSTPDDDKIHEKYSLEVYDRILGKTRMIYE